MCESAAATASLQAANASFDALTFEIWGALLNGAAVHVLRREAVLDPARFAERLRGGRFDHAVPDHGAVQSLAQRSIRSLFAGCDALVWSAARRCDAGPVAAVLRTAGRGVVLNVYGPTENTTFCDLVRGGDGWRPGAARRCRSAGRSSNTTASMCWTTGCAPVPIGVAGELLHRRRRSGARLSQPSGADGGAVRRRIRSAPGERLYRTGDLAALAAPTATLRVPRPRRPAGQAARLPHRARRDRGDARPAGRGARTRGDRPATTGGASAAGGLCRAAPALRRRRRCCASVCARALPEPMVPRRDRAARAHCRSPPTASSTAARLPAPRRASGVSRIRGAAHGAARRSCCASIWSELLGLERVGPRRQLLRPRRPLAAGDAADGSIRSRELSVELPLEAIFANPTVLDLAAAIDSGDGSGVAAPIERVDRNASPAVSFAQERLWFLAQLEADNPFYNTPFAYA